MKGFLYGQTEYNILNNTMHLEEYVNAAKQANMTFLSITDSNLHGYYKFITECKKNNIKPIIGLELTLNQNDNSDTFLVYALNNNGFSSLMTISSLVETESVETAFKKIKSDLANLALILVVSKSFPTRIDIDSARDLLQKYSRLPNFYLGISCQDFALSGLNNTFIAIGRDYGIKSLPLHQTLYLHKGDAKIYEYLTLIGGEKKSIPNTADYSFPTDLANEFAGNDDLFNNLDSLVSKIKLDLYSKRVELPKYPNTDGWPSNEFLGNLCHKGLIRRLGANSRMLPVYEKRLSYELDVINRMGYNDYFLIVWDFILYAKQNGVFVGPGRGSAAGSLAAFCLGITEVDPLKYDLLFERFLNPERISMPDIDTDFPDDKRDFVIEHVKNLYGSDHVCNISAFGTFLVKSSIRDLGRVMKIETSRLDSLVDLAMNATNYDELLAQFIDREDIYQLLYVAKKLENLPRHISTHAAGIILSKDSLFNIIPLQKGINNLYQSQIEAVDLEHIGLLKMDFLGIRNLAIIDNVLKEIGMTQRQMRNIPLDNKKTYTIYQNADTTGIFQMESEGMRRVLVKLHPTNFEDIVSILALYRPGPMDNIDEFIARRHGKPYNLPHPDLAPILTPTYGIIVYQEQIMRITQVFAGYSLGEADLLRRAVSKKDEQTLLKERSKFVPASVKKGYSSEVANLIYDYILKFANYGFNRSHTVAYAMLSYEMAYLKANYFPHFAANIMNNVIGSTKTLASYISYAKYHGVTTDKPNINYSTDKFVAYNGVLLMPLTAVFSIGATIVKQIIEERKKGLFKSLNDFSSRCDFVNTRGLEALVYAGAFDLFHKSRKSLIENSAAKTYLFDKHLDDVIESNEEYDIKYLAEQEKFYLGINIEYNLFKDAERILKAFSANPVGFGHEGQFVRYLCLLDDIKVILTKNDDYMGIGSIHDDASAMPVVIFPKAFNEIKDTLNAKGLVIVDGRLTINDRNGKLQLAINRIEVISNEK